MSDNGVEEVGAATGDSDDSAAETDTNAMLIEEGDIAADYLERLLDIIDYDGDIDLDVENDRAVVAIIGNDLQSLVGNRGYSMDEFEAWLADALVAVLLRRADRDPQVPPR